MGWCGSMLESRGASVDRVVSARGLKVASRWGLCAHTVLTVYEVLHTARVWLELVHSVLRISSRLKNRT